jgi:Ni,Fe-hydrogenase III small subunit/formate hydrogenlyase subunit 6/NADH:ubiquinone oxidoreductase subunit I
MPLDVARRLLTPFRSRVPGSRYPKEPPMLQYSTRGLPEVDPELCSRNGACVTVCPTNAISITTSSWTIDAGKCVFCGACALACPNTAIEMGSRVELAETTRMALVLTQTLVGRPDPLDSTAPSILSESADAASAHRERARLMARFGRSVHVRHLDSGACNGCDWEINSLLNHDIQRLGVDFVASPRHADLLLVTGCVTKNLEEAVLRTYDAMPEPRMVVAVGACAVSGGVFAGSPMTRSGLAGLIPVDVYVPGCPPRPEALIEAILLAAERRLPKA